MKLELNKYYTIAYTQKVFQAVMRNNTLVLKDLQASYSWDIGLGDLHTSGEYFEGYRVEGNQVEGNQVIPIQSYVGDGRRDKCQDDRQAVDLAMLCECEYEKVTVDLGEW